MLPASVVNKKSLALTLAAQWRPLVATFDRPPPKAVSARLVTAATWETDGQLMIKDT